jgi:hypothetical protein
MLQDQMEIKKSQEFAIRRQTPEEKEQLESDEAPSYTIELNLSKEEQESLVTQIFLEFEAMKTERTNLKLEDKWKLRDRQYDGELKANKMLAFNLHVHESKIKADAIVRAINEAFLDSEPMFDVTPRPESGRKNGFEIAEKQSQFLDYAIDEEIQPAQSLTSIAYSATKKFVGIGKLKWAFERERRRREETYDGSDIEIVAQTSEGQPIEINRGVERFLQAYPDAINTHTSYIKQLLAGKKINIVVEFKEIICNNPEIDYVKIENFYVRNACKGNHGLKDEHCIVERQSYTYWELKEKEVSEEFENVDSLWAGNDATNTENQESASGDYMTKEYDVLEVTTYFKKKDSDDEMKVKVWVGEEKKSFLGAIMFPYYGFDVDYLAFYLTTNDYGFYGDARSVIFDLLDTNLAQDALLNLTLDGIYKRNTVTPICESGSEIEEMFLDHTWVTGKPLTVDSLTDAASIGFVQYPNMDINGAMMLSEKMKRIGSDVARVNDNITGNESALDPDAPASKTLALLHQSGIGIKDYIRTFLPTFNNLASMLLQMYYQMSHEDRKYKVKSKSTAVSGENPFKDITREEMVVKTNLQSRASGFVFDKINEKREGIAAYQLVNSDPFAMQQPKVRYKALETLLQTFGQKWKAIADTTLMSPEEFAAQQEQVAIQAMQQIFQMMQQKAQVTGVQPDPREAVQQAPAAITQAQAEAYDPSLAPEEK